MHARDIIQCLQQLSTTPVHNIDEAWRARLIPIQGTFDKQLRPGGGAATRERMQTLQVPLVTKWLCICTSNILGHIAAAQAATSGSGGRRAAAAAKLDLVLLDVTELLCGCLLCCFNSIGRLSLGGEPPMAPADAKQYLFDTGLLDNLTANMVWMTAALQQQQPRHHYPWFYTDLLQLWVAINVANGGGQVPRTVPFVASLVPASRFACMMLRTAWPAKPGSSTTGGSSSGSSSSSSRVSIITAAASQIMPASGAWDVTLRGPLTEREKVVFQVAQLSSHLAMAIYNEAVMGERDSAWQAAGTARELSGSEDVMFLLLVNLAQTVNNLHVHRRGSPAAASLSGSSNRSSNRRSSVAGGVQGQKQHGTAAQPAHAQLFAALGMGGVESSDWCSSPRFSANPGLAATHAVIALQHIAYQRAGHLQAGGVQRFLQPEVVRPVVAVLPDCQVLPVLLVLIQLQQLQPDEHGDLCLAVRIMAQLLRWQCPSLGDNPTSAVQELASRLIGPVLVQLSPVFLGYLRKTAGSAAAAAAAGGAGFVPPASEAEGHIIAMRGYALMAMRLLAAAGSERAAAAYKQSPAVCEAALEAAVRILADEQPQTTLNDDRSLAPVLAFVTTILSMLVAAAPGGPAPDCELDCELSQQHFGMLLACIKALGRCSTELHPLLVLGAAQRLIRLVPDIASAVQAEMADALRKAVRDQAGPAEAAAAAAQGLGSDGDLADMLAKVMWDHASWDHASPGGGSSSSRGVGSSSGGNPESSAAASGWMIIVARIMQLVGTVLLQVYEQGAGPAGLQPDVPPDAVLAIMAGLATSVTWLKAPLRVVDIPGDGCSAAAPGPVLQQLQQQQQQLQQAIEDAVQYMQVQTSGYGSSSLPEVGVPDLKAVLGTAGPDLARQLQEMGTGICTQLPPGALFCGNPSCTNCTGVSEQDIVSGKSCICSGCKVVRYCGVQCQEQHWRAGHKAVCKRLRAHPPPPAAGSRSTARSRSGKSAQHRSSGAPGARAGSSASAALPLPATASEAAGLAVRQLKALLQQLGVPGAGSAIEKQELVALLVKHLRLE